jgi:hypothetical protein
MWATAASISRTSGTSISFRSATPSPIRPRTTRPTPCGRTAAIPTSTSSSSGRRASITGCRRG